MNSFLFHSAILLLFWPAQLLIAQDVLSKAVEAYNKGKYELCAEMLERGLDKSRPELEGIQYLANSYIALRKYDKAILSLRSALKTYPENEAILVSLSKLCTSEKQFGEAEKHLTSIKNYRNKTEVRALLSVNYYNDGIYEYQNRNLNRAIEQFKKCTDFDPLNKNAYTNAVSILHEQHRITEARELLEKTLKIFPGDQDFKKNYAMLLAETGEFKTAIPLLLDLNNVDEKDRSPEIPLLLARVLAADYQITRADSLLEYLLYAFPDNRQVYEEAVAHWNRFNNQKKLREAYQLDNNINKQKDEIELDIGQTYVKENALKEAEKYYKDILKTDTTNTRVQIDLARLYIKMNDDSASAEELQKIVKRTKNTEACRMLNNNYFKNQKYSEAIALNHFVEESYYTDYQLGLIYKQLNMKDSSEYYFEKAFLLNSSDPFILREKALIEKRRHDNSAAIKYARTGLKNSILLMQEKQDQLKINIAASSDNLAEGRNSASGSKEIEIIGENINQINTILEAVMSDSAYMNLLDDYFNLYPRSIFVLLFRADKLAECGQYTDAAETYRKVLLLNPSLTRAHSSLGEVQSKMGLAGEAILSFRRALELDKADPGIYSSLLSLNTRQGTASEYADELSLMYEENPDNKVLREALIEVLHKTGRFDDAKKIINEHRQGSQ